MTKRFDAVAWMRQRRAAIDEEDRGLSWEEKSRKTLAILRNDPLWQHVRGKPVPPPARRSQPSLSR